MSRGRDENQRQLIRLLKLLQRQSGHSAQVQLDDLMMTIVCAGKSYRFERAVVDRAGGEGMLLAKGDMITLAQPGVSFLKRALHPDEPFIAQHGDIRTDTVKIDGTQSVVTKNANESPLYRLYTRKQHGGSPWLNEAQFAAGERFRADFEKARLQPRISANWEASVAATNRGGGAADISDFAMDAKKRIEKALDALGPEMSDITLDICCFLKGLEQVELEQRWPPRSAKLILRTALTILARHYGLLHECRATAVQRRLRQWGAPDFRPQLNSAPVAQ